MIDKLPSSLAGDTKELSCIYISLPDFISQILTTPKKIFNVKLHYIILLLYYSCINILNHIWIVSIPFSPAEAMYISSFLRKCLINAGKDLYDIINAPSIPSYIGKTRIDVPDDMSHKISTLSLPELCIRDY